MEGVLKARRSGGTRKGPTVDVGRRNRHRGNRQSTKTSWSDGSSVEDGGSGQSHSKLNPEEENTTDKEDCARSG